MLMQIKTKTKTKIKNMTIRNETRRISEFIPDSVYIFKSRFINYDILDAFSSVNTVIDGYWLTYWDYTTSLCIGIDDISI